MSNGLGMREKIDRVEVELGISLPAQYKEFLSSPNAGSYERKSFNFLGSDGIPNSSTIRYFLFPEAGGRLDLKNTYEFYSDAERIPPGVLPVAKDLAGNLVCICINGKDAGKVYYWDHEQELDVEEHEDLACIAPDFPSFLSMLEGS
jgi:hypothetical protein